MDQYGVVTGAGSAVLMDVTALYRRSHSHLRVKNSRIFFNT